MDIRPIFSCVAESDEAYFRKVEALIESVRTFGGSLSNAPFIANFVGDIPTSRRQSLQELGAEVRIVERFDHRSALANKLRMLELDERNDFDVLVALDCDVVLVGDIARWLSCEQIRAKSVDYDYVSAADWRRLLGRLNIAMPEQTAIATSTGHRMIPYFNSGVLFVPWTLCGPLLSAWTRCLNDVCVLAEQDPRVIPIPLLSEQVALTCAIHRARMPFGLLPIGLNFPTHTPIHKRALANSGDVRILHYHADVDESGLLYRATCQVADRYIDEYNRRRAEQLGTAYSGLRARPWMTSARRVLRRRRRLIKLRGRTAWRAMRGAAENAAGRNAA